MPSCVKALDRLADAIRDLGDVPDRTNAMLEKLAIIGMQVLKTSPSAQARQVELLGQLMKDG